MSSSVTFADVLSALTKVYATAVWQELSADYVPVDSVTCSRVDEIVSLTATVRDPLGHEVVVDPFYDVFRNQVRDEQRGHTPRTPVETILLGSNA